MFTAILCRMGVAGYPLDVGSFGQELRLTSGYVSPALSIMSGRVGGGVMHGVNGCRMDELNLVGTKSMTEQSKCRAYSLRSWSSCLPSASADLCKMECEKTPAWNHRVGVRADQAL